MLGWQIYVRTENDETLARWTVSVGGLTWFDSMVERGQAEEIASNGYPTTYKTFGKHILSNLTSHNIPSYSGNLVLGDNYIKEAGLTTDVYFNDSALSACNEDSVIFIEAWDQS